MSESHATGPVRLLDEDPELYDAVAPSQRAQALQTCLAPSAVIPAGPWTPKESPADQDLTGLLVLDGILLRRVGLVGRFGAELLGPGDLLDPWDDPLSQASVPSTIQWHCVEKTRIALLTPAATHRLSRFPCLAAALSRKAVERSRRIALMIAIVHHPRTDIRLRMLFWHLADRWGRVRANGLLIPLRLSHSMLADLIAAQRPSVTGALKILRDEQLLFSTEDGWLLCGEPPAEFLELQRVSHG